MTKFFQELNSPENDLEIGIKGRGKRDQDSKDLKIIHVEFREGSGPLDPTKFKSREFLDTEDDTSSEVISVKVQ